LGTESTEVRVRGMRLVSPDLGLPVRFRARDSLGGGRGGGFETKLLAIVAGRVGV
jgi:hypothetical protein